ncbi:MAG: Na+/H+ antiporter subunit E [Alphaproteobacteria bacterium]|nr:Na+/H+ antiporter subunit E [Alphaproteobacteria bacterium]
MMTSLYGAILFLLWLLLSGHYDPLLMGLGIASVGLTVYLAHRMDIFDHESFPVQLTSRLPAFLVFILREIVKSNIDVLKRILSRDPNAVSPRLEEFPLPQKTDLGRVIYANAITLTPGTVSVELTKDSVIVHALAKDIADDLFTGEMARAIPDKVVEP